MALFVDTSVWSLAFRRDSPPNIPEVGKLRDALTQGDLVCSTGMVLLELLRGTIPPKASATIQTAFASLDLIEPTTADYVAAATVGNACRSAGIQIGSVDALIAHLVSSNGHTLLTTDKDFLLAQQAIDLKIWQEHGAK